MGVPRRRARDARVAGCDGTARGSVGQNHALHAPGFLGATPPVARRAAVPPRRAALLSLCALTLLLAGCGATGATGGGHAAGTGAAPTTAPVPATTGAPGSSTSTTGAPTTTTTTAPPGLGAPAALTAFPTAPTVAGEGAWTPAGRPVQGVPAVYETSLVPPGGTQAAGIAWMDTRLLSARLYSGSLSPGGGPYPYTAPVAPAQATSLVAAFNGGFKMATAKGGYYTTGKLIDPLVTGAASLVISSDGSVTVGQWGRTVGMSPGVTSVRQNLVLLVTGGQPTPLASSADWEGTWGYTCGVSACTASTPGVEHQWRSGVGETADGALVYVTGPGLAPIQLAQLLARAGAVRAMQLDINPYWDVFVSYDPATANGTASPTNGTKLVATTVQGPATFFDPSWARDFVTMSARPAGG